MIMPENLNKNLEQKSYTECVTHENYYSAFPAHASPIYPDPENPSPSTPQKKNQIWILCQNSLTRGLKIRVVGFVLKKLLTYFEMLIVPHALHCEIVAFLYFTSFDTIWHTVLVSVPLPPTTTKKFRIRFFVKIRLLESSI